MVGTASNRGFSHGGGRGLVAVLFGDKARGYAAVRAAHSMLLPEVSQAAGPTEELLLESLHVCSPKDALTRLQEGNARFAKAWITASAMGSPERRMHQLNSIWEQNCQIDPIALAKGQEPFAAILSCADSRVDPGWLFACGSGELFQVRSALFDIDSGW